MLFYRKYAVTLDASTAGSIKIRVALVKRDESGYLGSGDWTPAAGDVKISKDGGAEANIGTLPSFANSSWEFVLSGTELTCKVATVRVVDDAVELFSFIVETFGNASAMYAVDPTDAVRGGMTALPNANANASGGLFTRGTGAGQINQTANGRVDVNVVGYAGQNVGAVDASGYPKVTIKSGTGAGELNLNSGVVDADVMKISRDTDAADRLELQFDGTGLTGPTYPLQQSQIKFLVGTGLPIHVVPESFVLTTGTEDTGDYLWTLTLDGISHRITPSGGSIDCYYQLDVDDATAGAVKIAATVETSGAQVVYARNWSGGVWEEIGFIVGNTAGITVHVFALLPRHTGTGADAGKVRIRFAGTSGALDVDQILVGAALMFDPATDTVANVGTVATLTGHTAQTGDAYAVVNHGTWGNNALYTLLTSTGVRVKDFVANAITAAAINAGAFVGAKFGSDFWTKLIASVWTDAGSRSLTDKAGFELAADQAVNVTKVGGTIVSGPNDLKADVSALLTSSAFTSALPANFASLAIDGSGRITVGSMLAAVIEAIAVEVDARLLDAGDATDLIASIVTRIGNTNVDQAALVAAIKASLFDAGSAANKLSVDSSGRVTVGSNADKTGYALDASQRVKLHADQPDYEPAVAGDEMNLADAAISGPKFDGSTAYPVTSVDTGATRLARTGADGDTLKTLSDQADGIHSKTTNLPGSPAAAGDAMTLTTGERNAVRSGLATGTNVGDAQTAIQGSITAAVAAIRGGDETLESLKNAIENIGSGLTGPNVVNVTVKSAATGELLEGATVCLVKDAARDPKETTATGVTQHTIEDGESWTIRVRHPRFIGQTRARPVSGGGTYDELFELETLIVALPDAPEKITGVLLCLNKDEDPAEGVEVRVRITQGRVGFDGETERLETSDPDGFVQFPHVRGWWYEVQVGDGAWRPYRAPLVGDLDPDSFDIAVAVGG